MSVVFTIPKTEPFNVYKASVHRLLLSNPITLPFTLRRIFWVNDVPDGQHRGTHAHRQTFEVLRVHRGRAIVHTQYLDGTTRQFTLTHANEGLLIPPYVWKSIEFQNDALLEVFTSAHYDEADYIEWEEFCRLAQTKSGLAIEDTSFSAL
jgi:mannose-6-phosphate isomerase-like protein (cupin superfamily)